MVVARKKSTAVVCSIFLKGPDLILLSNKIRLKLINPFVMSINRHNSKKTPCFFSQKSKNIAKPSYGSKRLNYCFDCTMGSTCSPVIENVFIERFERQALSSATNPPKIWLRYVDDTFLIL